jgi:hypothetical protein
MNPDLQYLVVIGIVALAAVYVLWTVIVRMLARGKTCGGSCSGCSSQETMPGEPKGFVSLDALLPPARKATN